MESLHQKIKCLEQDIERRKLCINYEGAVLHEYARTPTFLYLALGSGFVFGFLIAETGKSGTVRSKLTSIPSLFNFIYKNALIILPFFKI